MRRLLSCVLMMAACAWPQTPDPLDIRGVVTEPGTNLAIAGVQVTLYEFVEDQTRLVVRRILSKSSTDERGAFQFHVEHFGDYFLEVKKEGYSALTGGPVGDTENAEASVTLRQDRPFPEQRFSLMRPGALTGRLIDEDGKPIVGLRVSAQTKMVLPTSLQPSAITDAEGSFLIGKLAPDKYQLRIAPKSGDSEVVMQTFTDDDLKAVDQDFETSYWPMTVSPGASSSLGTITVRKTAYYRAHVSVVAEECGPKEGWRFSALLPGSTAHFAPVLCAKEFLVRNLKPGSYWFTLSNAKDGAANRQGLGQVEVRSENVEVRLTMAAGGSIDGRMVAAEGVTLPALSGVLIQAAPLIQILGMASRPAQPDSGAFSLQNLAPAQYRIFVVGLNRKYYVKEFRYDGLPVPDGVFTAAPGGKLEIVVDDQAGVINGSVTDGFKPANQASVLLFKRPVPPADTNQGIVGVDVSGEDGRFQLAGIAPGQYRIVAIANADGRFVENPSRFLNSAETVSVERGSARNVVLKVTDPSR